MTKQNLLVSGMAIVGVISNDTQSQATISSVVEIIIDVRCSTGQMMERCDLQKIRRDCAQREQPNEL
jgi:hypothetical protein